MGVPPSSILDWDFPLQNIHFGVPPCMETPIGETVGEMVEMDELLQTFSETVFGVV